MSARLFLVEIIASPLIASGESPPGHAGDVRARSSWPARCLALWATAPLIAYRSQPGALAKRRVRGRRSPVPSRSCPQHVAILRGVHGPRRPRLARGQLSGGSGTPDGPPDIAHEHRMGLLATLAAHDLGFIRTDELASRIDAALTTMEGLERFEGHLFNWYDTQSLAPLPPAYVSTVDSGNLAGALMILAEGLRQASRQPPRRGRTGRRTLPTPPRPGVPRRPVRGRHELPVPLRSAAPDPLHRLSSGRRRGTGPAGCSYYDLLASESRLTSFIGIAKGDLPETHWFHLDDLSPVWMGSPRFCLGAPPFRIPDAAPVHEELSGNPPRPVVPDGRTAADRVCGGSRRALGDLGVRLQPRGSARYLSV